MTTTSSLGKCADKWWQRSKDLSWYVHVKLTIFHSFPVLWRYIISTPPTFIVSECTGPLINPWSEIYEVEKHSLCFIRGPILPVADDKQGFQEHLGSSVGPRHLILHHISNKTYEDLSGSLATFRLEKPACFVNDRGAYLPLTWKHRS